MLGMPSGMGAEFDPSMLLLSGHLLASLGYLIAGALGVGLITLPVFFLVLFALEQLARLAAATTGSFTPKVVLIMFRGLVLPPWFYTQAWAMRLHAKRGGIPYGVALAAAGLWIYPNTLWFKAFAL